MFTKDFKMEDGPGREAMNPLDHRPLNFSQVSETGDDRLKQSVTDEVISPTVSCTKKTVWEVL